MKPALLSAIIVLAVAGFFGYKIFSKDQREAQRILAQRQQELELGKRRSQLEETLGVVESYRRRLSPENDVVWLVQTAGNLAREANIHLAAINPKRPRHFGEFTQLSVSLHFTTSYHQLGHFLSRIEGGEYLLSVDQLDFTLVRQEDGSAGAGVDLVISTVHLPPVTL